MTGTADRKKFLIHLRRISTLFSNAIMNGPDGTLEGKYAEEHPLFIHYACSLYLIGTIAYLAGEDGAYSWKKSSDIHQDFDQFAAEHPTGKKWTFGSRGITRFNLDALAQLRNAVAHHDGDLSENNNKSSLEMVTQASIPGVCLRGSIARLEHPILEHTRITALAVRCYFGDG